MVYKIKGVVGIRVLEGGSIRKVNLVNVDFNSNLVESRIVILML